MKPSLWQLLRWTVGFTVLFASGDLASSTRTVEPRLGAGLLESSAAFDTATDGSHAGAENGTSIQRPSVTEANCESETSALAGSPSPSIVEGLFGFTFEIFFDSEENVSAPRSTPVGRLRRSVAQARAPPSTP